jgi:hypothetical protein
VAELHLKLGHLQSLCLESFPQVPCLGKCLLVWGVFPKPYFHMMLSGCNLKVAGKLSRIHMCIWVPASVYSV